MWKPKDSPPQTGPPKPTPAAKKSPNALAQLSKAASHGWTDLKAVTAVTEGFSVSEADLS